MYDYKITIIFEKYIFSENFTNNKLIEFKRLLSILIAKLHKRKDVL